MLNSPAYARVYSVLKREIIEGEIVVGDFLPPEPELEKRFNVSRTTIRKANELLAREGFVKAQQGRGTQVLDYSTKQNLNIVTSISETLRQKGYDVRPKSTYIDIINPTSTIMEELGLSEGEKVTRIQRIQLADENPIVIMKNYVPSRMVPGMENQAEKITSLYQYLEDVFNIHIDSAHDRISARAADFNQAQMLNIPVGSPLLYMRRVCYSNGIAVCADHISVIADKYELEVEMIGRENRNIY